MATEDIFPRVARFPGRGNECVIIELALRIFKAAPRFFALFFSSLLDDSVAPFLLLLSLLRGFFPPLARVRPARLNNAATCVRVYVNASLMRLTVIKTLRENIATARYRGS